ncbi:MAG: twin-arginine translocase TatA/TatE family subunit [Gammaproteobacteria bacterium]|nr:twin-arginine translocase TatA/TatE family subunit [Gammaproteobacteria bacterium]
MGVSGIGIGSLIVILIIVVLLFGTKKLSSIGSDLGGAIKGFRSAMDDADKDKSSEKDDSKAEQIKHGKDDEQFSNVGKVIDGEADPAAQRKSKDSA